MDEDCEPVLVIDLDDDGKDDQNDYTSVNKEMRLITDKNRPVEDKVEYNYNKDYQIKSKRLNRNNDHNSDDECIEVIDDDENYTHSNQNLIHKDRQMHLYAQLNAATNYRKRINDSQKYNTYLIDGDRNRFGDHHELAMERGAVNMDITGDRIVGYVNQNRGPVRTGYEPLYKFRHVMDDIHLTREVRIRDQDPLRSEEYMINTPKIPYRLESLPRAYRPHDTNRPDTLNIDNYHHAYVNRHTYRPVYRPEINVDNDLYANDVINRSTHLHDLRPEVFLSADDFRHSGITRDVHDTYRTENLHSLDEYRRAEMNKNPYVFTHRLEEDMRLNELNYRHAAREREAYSYAYRPAELTNYDEYRIAANNRFSRYRPVNDLEDYRQTTLSRHAYVPETIISIEDYDRMAKNWHEHYNAYKSPVALSLDPYRTIELANVYTPDLVDIDRHREPKLIRNANNPGTTGMYGYKPEINLFRSVTHDDYRNDEAKLNISHKNETITKSANRSRHKNIDVIKLQHNAETQFSMLPLNMINAQKSVHSNTADYKIKQGTVKRNNKPLPNSKKSEIAGVCKPGAEVTTQIPDTIIMRTKNIYKKKLSKSFISATRKANDDHTQNIKKTAAEFEKFETTLSKNNEKCEVIREVNKKHEEKSVNNPEISEREIYNLAENNKVRLLVGYFRRVKEMVKETFPEFSKSLEKEIDNLGEWTDDGRLKIDIQFICPLYCSVSTYSLPRFDDTDDDSKIEKHVNRIKICDICSCIQRCYKLFKQNNFNLISSKAHEQPSALKQGDERMNKCIPIIDGVAGPRFQSVKCKRQATDCEENNHNQELQGDRLALNVDSKISDRDTHNMFIDKQPLAGLNEQCLLDSLSELNFNLSRRHIKQAHCFPAVSIDNDILYNDNMPHWKDIEKSVQNTLSDNEDIFTRIEREARVDEKKYPRDEDEANLMLSLSANEITNADIIGSKLKDKTSNKPDIIGSKLKDKISKKPDTVFTCHICTCIFTYFTSFVSHMQKEHNLNEIDEDIPDECIARKCPFCGTYSKQNCHNDHFKRAHPEMLTHKGEQQRYDTQLIKVNKKKQFKKRKFIFKCLLCHKDLKSNEVKRHREKEHSGMKVAKMFTKKLSSKA